MNAKLTACGTEASASPSCAPVVLLSRSCHEKRNPCQVTACCYRYVTLPAVEGNASRGLIGNSTFLAAGASKPTVSNSSDANECSFGETYRNGKRGGQYIALTADIPYSTLYVSIFSPALADVTEHKQVCVCYTDPQTYSCLFVVLSCLLLVHVEAVACVCLSQTRKDKMQL